MRFCCLGSGSKGNATLVQMGDTLILIDCGFSLKYMLAALAEKSCGAEDIDAILVTHEHADHISGVNTLAKRFSIPIYTAAGTLRTGKIDTQKNTVHLLQLDKPIDIAGVEVLPVTVPHDAKEPCQFVFTAHDKRLGVMTDLGSISAHVAKAFAGCDALLLEANHDVDMLWAGPYPQSLKRRVLGEWGHLSNVQAAAFLHSLDALPKTLVLGHISEKNNSELLVEQVFKPFAQDVDQIIFATQDSGFDWIEV
ncbi:MAG: MBL fold metallo-hydrolase [Pseudomonadales bacterium]|nr:MBL fold metallo-hydrolase [Pseudomonadales bacterium]